MLNSNATLESYRWEGPDSYAGYNPEGEYCLISRHRDSDCLSDSNYYCFKNDLEKLAKKLNCPESIYEWSAGHWACGFVEYIMLKESAPQELKDFAAEKLEELEQYPVYDESDYSEREWNRASEVWRDCYTVRDRVELIKKYAPDCSIFASRRDSLPDYEADLISVLCE